MRFKKGVSEAGSEMGGRCSRRTARALDPGRPFPPAIRSRPAGAPGWFHGGPDHAQAAGASCGGMPFIKIGRAAWRGKGEISGVAGSLKKKKSDAHTTYESSNMKIKRTKRKLRPC